ncbi:MAG: leucine-rich repeat protein [Oscillospiraceae bacterium]|nr:leucine-rich repeat protein [Oscillospiraceae bacterium]
MKKQQKILATVLCVLFCLSAPQIPAQAEDQELSEEISATKQMQGAKPQAVLQEKQEKPENIDDEYGAVEEIIAGYEQIDVTGIQTLTYGGYKNLKRIKLPDTVTSIGINAFSGCSSLTNIIIPQNVLFMPRESVEK